MTNQLPQKIDLTDEEEALLNRIDFHPRHDDRFEEVLKLSCESAAPLAHSILSRKAVPEIRLRYFTDPELNIGLKKSRKQVFETNGTKGEAILNHPHFLKYLQYFIYGPLLPCVVIDDFWRLATGFDPELDQLCKFSRRATRQFSLHPREASEEFFKLALECGMNDYEARVIRDTVKAIR